MFQKSRTVSAIVTWKHRNSGRQQRGRIGKGVVFTTTLIEWSGFNRHPSHAVALLDKTLYDDYLCLVASNKQQI